MHSIKNNLALLAHSNHHLADELAKIPEIRKFKTDSTRLALDNLLKIYWFAPDRFRKTPASGVYSTFFNPPEADKGLIPRPLGRIKITDGYPVACSGVVH